MEEGCAYVSIVLFRSRWLRRTLFICFLIIISVTVISVILSMKMVYSFQLTTIPVKMTYRQQLPVNINNTELGRLSGNISNTELGKLPMNVNNTELGKVILLWTALSKQSFINAIEIKGTIKCGPHRHKCFVTGNKDLFNSSSAVVFHIVEDDFLDDLFVARSMNRPPDQRWIFYSKEAPPRVYEYSDIMPHCKSLFNWTMTYKFSSDIRQSYADIIPGKFKGGYDSNKNYLENRTKTAIAFISNCHGMRRYRMRLINNLKKHIDVDIYGRCGKPCNPNCFSLLPKYKFYLAFENSICEDYITEKTYRNALMNEIVPVIISGANLSNPAVVPPKSFINGLDFKKAVDLANYLKQVGSNHQLYNEFFKWRNNWTIVLRGTSHIPCDICDKLYKPNQTIKIYHDISGWFSSSENCKPFPNWKASYKKRNKRKQLKL